MKSLQRLTNEQVDPFFLEWSRISGELATLHKERKKGANTVILTGIEVYKRLLSYCREALQDDEFQPLNGSERLSFIEASPGAYAAYRQLDELFTELRKTIARKRIELKRLNE